MYYYYYPKLSDHCNQCNNHLTTISEKNLDNKPTMEEMIMRNVMETKKVALACFIGGCLGTAAALVCTPIFWWLGLITGITVAMVSGYFSYEWKQVLTAIPHAWEESREKTRGIKNSWRRYRKKNYRILLFFLLSNDVGFCLVLSTLYNVYPSSGPGIYENPLILVIALTIMMCVLVGIIIASAFFVIYFAVSLLLTSTLQEILKGSVTFFKFMSEPVVDCGIFFKKLFIRIHSDQRVLCAIDSAIGAVSAYFLFLGGAIPMSGQIFVVICGGLIGMALGVVNYQLVSVRWLKLGQEINHV